MLLWCWFLWKLEQRLCTIWSQHCQVTKWLDNLLCKVSHHLGFQTAIPSCTLYHWGWIYCFIHGPTRCHSRYGTTGWNPKQEFPGPMHSTHCVLQSVWGQLWCTWTCSSSKGTKHINVCYHHFREHVRLGLIKVLPISTDDQIADALTKPLTQNAFCKHRRFICGA